MSWRRQNIKTYICMCLRVLLLQLKPDKAHLLLQHKFCYPTKVIKIAALWMWKCFITSSQTTHFIP